MAAPTPGLFPGPVGVAVLGAGNVGGALVPMLLEDSEGIARRSGVQLEVVGVAVADPGRPRRGIPASLLTGDALNLVGDPRVDVVVELIGGIHPAKGLVEAAIAAGKPVVTANKELLAAHGAELAAAAAAGGVDLLYEAAVAGAIPIIRPLRESLAGERVRRVMGIVNGTTNFILTTMSESGGSYDDALSAAQRLGYAERDPTADVEGHDAAAKAAILATLAFRHDVADADVDRQGISSIQPVDIEFARRLGYVVKLLAVAEHFEDTDEISVRVHPAMIPATHPLAAVRGAYNAVFVEGEACGELMLYGRGAGGLPTASAVLGDVLDAAHNLRSGAPSRPVPRGRARVRPMDDLRCAWYLNIDVLDRPGVLAAVARVFGEHGVSIRSMEQVGLGDEARLIFLTHVARDGDVAATIEGLRALDVVEHVGGVVRVLGDEEDAAEG
jgi:homoserine dehydrogenase